MLPKLIIFLTHASLMMSALFIPNYAKTIGATLVEIGLVGTAYGFSLFVSSYVFSRASDIRGRIKFIISGLFLSAISFFLQITATTPILLILVRSMTGLSLGIFSAPLIAFAHDRGAKMGNLSSYGSMGWAMGVLFAGIIAQQGEKYFGNSIASYHVVFAISSILFVLSFFIIFLLSENNFKPLQQPLSSTNLLLKNFRVYFSTFLRQFGAFTIWSIFPLFLEEKGANKFWIGMLYFINTGFQTIIMRFTDPIDEIKLIKIGLLMSFMVFYSYTLVPNFWWIIPLQIFLAFGYSFWQTGDLVYLTKRNKEKAASVGILNSILGFCLGIGPLFGGFISEYYGFHAVMFFGSFLALCGFLVMTAWPQHPKPHK